MGWIWYVGHPWKSGEWRLSILIVGSIDSLRSQQTTTKHHLPSPFSRPSAVMSSPYDRSPTSQLTLRPPPDAIAACPRNEMPHITLWGPDSQENCSSDGHLTAMVHVLMSTIGSGEMDTPNILQSHTSTLISCLHVFTLLLWSVEYEIGC